MSIDPHIDLSLIELLSRRAADTPTQTLYTFAATDSTEPHLTYVGLHRRAMAIASVLRTYADPGARALLLFPPGLEYITAFFGCLYAGIVAVPAYPPHLNRPSPRLRALIADAGATLALTTHTLYADMGRLLTQEPTLQALQWVASDTIASDAAAGWHAPTLTSDHLAFLQYTSGSTGTPKGVMLTHRNLLTNLALIQKAFRTTRDSRGVIWLPPYHDMGLIGGILQPLYGGFPVYLMPPVAFLQRPISWLEAISRFRATASGGPNFAYELCIHKTTPEQREGLDLSSWEVAFNGAEPIREATLQHFTKTFAPYGFRPTAFYPCYGLAEATLLVSGGDAADTPVIKTFGTGALEQKVAQAVLDNDATTSQALVSSGRVFDNHQIVIANPDTATNLADGEIGEIWVAGGSIAQGYWQRPVETETTFHATLPHTNTHFMRTGDLGFLQDGELFVTGRLKELLILRGRNHYPQDIEHTVETSHSAFNPGSGAAFTVPVDGEERLVVVYEVDRHAMRSLNGEQVAQQARQAVAQQHEIQLYDLVLIRTATLLKTSSGKIQRRACRDQYLQDELTVLYRHAVGQSSTALSTNPAPVAAESPFILQALQAVTDPATRQTLLVLYLQEQLARRLRTSVTEVPAHLALSSLGVDSLLVVDFSYHIATVFGVELPLTFFFDDVTLQDVAERIAAGQTTPAPTATVAAGTAPTTFPATHGQQALWFLQQITPDSTAYHIICALKSKVPLNSTDFRHALTRLLERHEALRATFAVDAGNTVQRIGTATPDFVVIPASGWNDAQIQQHGAEEAQHPFDLAQDALLRVRLYERADNDDVLLIVAHHIVTDLWSLTLMLQELGTLYEGIRTGQVTPLAPLTRGFHDFVAHQEQVITSAQGAAALDYWRTQLNDGHVPVLALPLDHPRPPLQTWQGASHTVTLDVDLAARLRTFSREQGVTLYVTLLSLYTLLLHRYSGQDDIVVGTPSTGRSDSSWANVVGYCINPMAIRSRVQDDLSITDFLQQIRRTVLEGLAHQDYPFALLTKQLTGTGRDPSYTPIFQTMFMFQQAIDPALTNVLALALNLPGTAFQVGGLTVEPLPVEQHSAQFDLTLMMAESVHGLHAVFQYNRDLFDSTTIERFASHFTEAARHFVDMGTRPVAHLPLLTAAERHLLLTEWNDTIRPYQATPIEALFAAQAARTPDASALIFESETLTYADLNARANQVAHHLRSLGVGPNVRVGVCMHRSVEMIVALLGILKAGGAYVPLDPTYPSERIAFVLDDAAISILLTQPTLAPRFSNFTGEVLAFGAQQLLFDAYPTNDPPLTGDAERVAYVIYTSGSTGTPKGVMVPHRAVANFFVGMDERIGASTDDTLLAVTSMSFDISVLELFWTLTRGAKVVLLAEDAATRAPVTPSETPTPPRNLSFSLFYFASDEGEGQQNKYHLLLEGAKFADRHGFEAVWTPERHFHAFGGLYPNPAITSAAVAAITERVQIRAGSVVLPLHNPIRVAEDWSVIDNISNGRVGIAFASGWHADDFVFFPQNYETRREVTLEGINTVRRLWRGDAVEAVGGVQQPVSVRILPRPVQAELPVWVTAAGNPQTFIEAGSTGANVLTHLLGQTLSDLTEKIALYRKARAEHGYDPDSGKVTLMLHAFIGPDAEAVRETVRGPFSQYLRTSVGLMAGLARSLNLPFNLNDMTEAHMTTLLSVAFDRYYNSSALFGTPDSVQPLLDTIRVSGIDEIACLVDFGVASETVLAHLPYLHKAAIYATSASVEQDFSLITQARRHQPTLFQCTPSLMRLAMLNPETVNALQSLRVLMLGGEALPPALATHVKQTLPCRLVNMYGPTETTIWSTTHEVHAVGTTIPLGTPIANTQLYVLDRQSHPTPIGVAGELYIGGDGVTHGYWQRPDLTESRFVPDPFHPDGTRRLYRTGDMARWRADGTMEFLGRADFQIKLRGFRIELGEIEAVLTDHPTVQEAVVVARKESAGDVRLIAYLVIADTSVADAVSQQMREFLKQRLPDYMVPALFVTLAQFPLTANGKVDRAQLPAPEHVIVRQNFVAPRSQLERDIAAIWRDALKVEEVSTTANFFDLGGHSLLMAQVHQQLQQLVGRDVPLVKLLEYPTVDALARYLATVGGHSSTAAQGQNRAERQLAARTRRTGRTDR